MPRPNHVTGTAILEGFYNTAYPTSTRPPTWPPPPPHPHTHTKKKNPHGRQARMKAKKIGIT